MLIHKNVIVKEAVEDTDLLIGITAISLTAECDAVEIIWENIDLLVLFRTLTFDLPIYFWKSGTYGLPYILL